MPTRRGETLSQAVNASAFRFAIVLSGYHAALGEALLRGATACLEFHGVKVGTIPVFRVPGAYEIPQAVAYLLEHGGQRMAGVIALGVLIRGDTLHFEILAREVCHSLQTIALRSRVPVGFGVLTVDSESQARDRTGRGKANKGWEAADAVVRMAALFRSLERPGPAGTRAPRGRQRDRDRS